MREDNSTHTEEDHIAFEIASKDGEMEFLPLGPESFCFKDGNLDWCGVPENLIKLINWIR